MTHALSSLVPWVGGRLTLDGILRRLGVGFELGRHRAPVSRMDPDDVVVRRFGRWEPLGQLMLRLQPWSPNGSEVPEEASGVR